ncbi:CHASE2 domain-containing protein [Microcoleus sp. FACHB-68]|uniref:CHASE2 domain-containing protein n=1 Tax=Microcoleus sp. FACHB-68 TaxID=2692826 RepID=UPI0016853F4A|nr:CHASE2 domain-containing protein [Microcoleus sp. FACHB-68]MBD1936837.1 CHASE2 domain-containing protein [Microcoleus sp. FACHB-68]
MSKLVVLELDGNLESQGFRVTLEIGSDGETSQFPIKIKGGLPPNPNLARDLHFHWQENYRNLGNYTRIKTKKIIHKGSINKRLADCIDSAKLLRNHLKSWLKEEGFREIDNRLREELSRDETIRFLICSEDSNIQKLPWHKWDFFERYPKAEVALSPLESKSTQKFTGEIKTKACVSVLAILGHKEGIDIEKDLQLLKNLRNVNLTFLVEPEHQEINEQLWGECWDIIFFAGHSETQGETGRIYINPTDSLTIPELWYGLQKAIEGGLKLAIFNSCDGLGLARQLGDLHIPQMIVMRELIPDQIAQEFLKHFLKAFAGGQSLYLAVREARQRLHDDFEREFPCASWLPVICQQPAEIPPTWNQLLGNSESDLPSLPSANFPKINLSSPYSVKKQRTLAAIIFTDAVRFSTRMATNEEETLTLLNCDLALMTELCNRFEGKVLKSTGDGLLMYFSSATQATTCAIEIQTTLLNTASLPPAEKLLHRIGIHLGDVLFNDSNVMGNGVNIAARLQAEAEPGGILISQTVYEVVKNSLSLEVSDLGERQLKNIPNPIRVYQILQKQLSQDNNRKRKLTKILSINQYKPVFLAGIFVTILVMGMRGLGLFQTLELKAFDQLMRLRPDEGIDSRLLVVEATENDINQYGFPLPDATIAQVIEKLDAYQPRIIALDIFRNSLLEPGHAQLSRQFQYNNRLIAVCSAGEANNPKKPGIKPPPKLPESRLGFTDVVEDLDGILRRHLMFMQPYQDDPCVTNYALSTRVALDYLAAEGIKPQALSREKVKLGKVIFQDLEVNTGAYKKLDNGGFQILLNYRKNISTIVGISEILKNQVDPHLFKNKIILIGVTAPTAVDNFSSPYSAGKNHYERTPGVLIQAQMVSQILSAVLDQRPLLTVWNQWAEAFWIGGWAISAGVAICQINHLRYRVIAVVVTMGVLCGVCLGLLIQGFWVPVVPSLVAILATSGIIIWQARLLTNDFKH